LAGELRHSLQTLPTPGNSSRQEAAVDDYDRACRILRGRQAQKDDGAGHIRRLAPALKRGAVGDPLVMCALGASRFID
jgi:hypothetical protein